jgi:hypothetical protein
MNAAQVNASFDLVGYASAIVELRKSGGYYIGPCPACGGRDRFNLKHTQSGDVWICRQCTNDKYHSVIDFFMRLKGLDFKAALQMAGGEIDTPTRREPPTPPKIELPSEGWQRKAWHIVFAASDRLTREPEGEAGRRYLVGRGISKGSIYAFWLGYATAYGRPCIVIPYFDSRSADPDAGNLVAVKYRFIDPQAQKGNRFSMLSGSNPLVFGLNQVYGGETTLLLCEGELNAVSIVQTRPQGIATVSAGSDTNGGTVLRNLAEGYKRVVVWMDDTEKARELRAKIGRSDATIIKSPVDKNIKYDANQMLMENLLHDFIEGKLSTVCQGKR